MDCFKAKQKTQKVMRPNIFRTLIFNFRAFGLRSAMKLPVYVYGRVKVYKMGCIELHGPICRGMFRIGMNYTDTLFPYTVWNNMGTIEVHGRTWINHGCNVQNRGRIVFRGGDIISQACVLDIHDCLELGKNVSVGYGSEFIDSDIHYMMDVMSRKVLPNTRAIRIGAFNWLGSHTYVKKGTVTPDYTIVASPNALLLKDYTQDLEPYSILGGSPARVIGKGKCRIFNHQNEIMITSVLESKDSYEVDENVDLDEFCGFKKL